MNKIITLAFLLLFALSSRAQNNSLVFTTDTFHFNPILNPGDTLYVLDSLYTDTLSVVYGPVTFGARVNSLVLADSQWVYPTFPATDSFVPGLRTACVFGIPADTAHGFEIGPNLVVIWPIYNGGGHPSPNDSIYILQTYAPTGINNPTLSNVYVYTVPGYLNINLGSAENIVQQVRIYDILGQSLFTCPGYMVKDVYTGGWASSVYFCEISTFDGQKRVFKFRPE